MHASQCSIVGVGRHPVFVAFCVASHVALVRAWIIVPLGSHRLTSVGSHRSGSDMGASGTESQCQLHTPAAPHVAVLLHKM